MPYQITFYLSIIINRKFFSISGEPLGKIKDIIVDFSLDKPKVIAVKAKVENEIRILDFSYFDLRRVVSR